MLNGPSTHEGHLESNLLPLQYRASSKKETSIYRVEIKKQNLFEAAIPVLRNFKIVHLIN